MARSCERYAGLPCTPHRSSRVRQQLRFYCHAGFPGCFCAFRPDDSEKAAVHWRWAQEPDWFVLDLFGPDKSAGVETLTGTPGTGGLRPDSLDSRAIEPIRAALNACYDACSGGEFDHLISAGLDALNRLDSGGAA